MISLRNIAVAAGFAVFGFAVFGFARVAAADPPTQTVADEAIVVTNSIPKDAAGNPFNGVPSVMHTVRLSKDKIYQIELASARGTPILTVVDPIGNPLAHGQHRSNNLSRLRFTPPRDDAYMVFAGFQGLPPDAVYSLSIKPYVVPPAKLIETPWKDRRAPLQVDAVLSENDTPDQYRDFPGKIYVVELTAGKRYVIDLTTRQFDAFLLLQNNRGALIAQDDDSGGNLNSRIQFQPTASGPYRLVASTYNGRMGAFTLRVVEQP